MDERRLLLIADQLLEKIKHRADPYIRAFRENGTKSERRRSIGRIKTLVDPKVLGPLVDHFGDVIVQYTLGYVNVDGKKRLAFFDPNGDGIIAIGYPIYYTNDNRRPPDNDINNVVVHELRHALDNSLSGGKIFSDDKIARRTQPTGRDDDAYLRDPTEINARVSQILPIIRRRVYLAIKDDEPLTRQRLHRIMIHELDSIQLVNIFGGEEKAMRNKAFRRIYSRVISYVQEFLKDM